MYEFRQITAIHRPPQQVFGVLTRFEDIPKYVPQVTSAEQTSPGEVSLGTTFVQRGRLLGRTMETPTVVTAFDPHRRFGYRAEQGPVPYEALYDFRPRDGGTLVEVDVLRSRPRAQPSLPSWLAEPASPGSWLRAPGSSGDASPS